MRNKSAKNLKKRIAVDMYVGDGVTVEDIRKEKKSVYASPDFKKIYRARKKNELKKKRETSPKHMAENTDYDPVAKKMHDHRMRKQNRKSWRGYGKP